MPFFNVELSRLAASSVGQTVTAHTGPYTVDLSTSPPNKDGTGITLPGAGVNYAAASLPITAWTTASNGAQSNNAAIQFNQASGAGWGTVTHAVVKDQAGNLVFFAPLASSQAIAGNVTFSIPVGGLTNTIA